MQIKKVVPIILRQHDLGLQLLVFQHPLAGIQIVKGTVELNESLEEAALRELFEETGIQSAHIQKFLGIHYPKENGPDWCVFVCETQENLLDQWVHYCHDDGGLEFKFFWHFLYTKPTSDWHSLFQDLLVFIQDNYESKYK